MTFFQEVSGKESQDVQIDTTELMQAPLSNLGCESEFAKLDNRLKISGGTTSVETLSKKNVGSTNGFLVDSSYLDLSEQEKKQKWKWARASEEVKEMLKLKKDFLETVKASKSLA